MQDPDLVLAHPAGSRRDGRAGYTGLAIASTSHRDRLFAANFAQGRIDVFNSSFHQVRTARWQFRDPRLPRGYLRAVVHRRLSHEQNGLPGVLRP